MDKLLMTRPLHSGDLALKLAAECLRWNPDTRTKIAHLISHDWLKQRPDLDHLRARVAQCSKAALERVVLELAKSGLPAMPQAIADRCVDAQLDLGRPTPRTIPLPQQIVAGAHAVLAFVDETTSEYNSVVGSTSQQTPQQLDSDLATTTSVAQSSPSSIGGVSPSASQPLSDTVFCQCLGNCGSRACKRAKNAARFTETKKLCCSRFVVTANLCQRCDLCVCELCGERPRNDHHGHQGMSSRSRSIVMTLWERGHHAVKWVLG